MNTVDTIDAVDPELIQGGLQNETPILDQLLSGFGQLEQAAIAAVDVSDLIAMGAALGVRAGSLQAARTVPADRSLLLPTHANTRCACGASHAGDCPSCSLGAFGAVG